MDSTMDDKTIPTFEIPKLPEQSMRAQALPDVDPGVAKEGTHEILPQPVQGIPQQDDSSATSAMMPLHDNMAATTPPIMTASTTVPLTQDQLTAADADVIEKEWVTRAKKIIETTSEDPHTEVKELNKLKRSYMKKRFDKDIVPIKDVT